jgi:hypothetical protein
VIFQYFGGHPRICISFIFAGSLEATCTFSSYKRGQFITTISIAREEHSNLQFRFYTTMAKISLKSEGFARL